MHRRIIWSFSKSYILNKPILGNGIFSARLIGDNEKIINSEGKAISAIPLHPHNATLQIWLELGLVGIIIFYVFIIAFVNKINSLTKVDYKYKLLGQLSLIQIFTIGQLSYGFWQHWWLSVVIINILFYKILYESVKLSENKA